MHYNNEDMLINYDFYGLHELDSDNFLTNYDTAQLHNKSKSFESFPVGEIRANALNQRLDWCNRLYPYNAPRWPSPFHGGANRR